MGKFAGAESSNLDSKWRRPLESPSLLNVQAFYLGLTLTSVKGKMFPETSVSALKQHSMLALSSTEVSLVRSRLLPHPRTPRARRPPRGLSDRQAQSPFQGAQGPHFLYLFLSRQTTGLQPLGYTWEFAASVTNVLMSFESMTSSKITIREFYFICFWWISFLTFHICVLSYTHTNIRVFFLSDSHQQLCSFGFFILKRK